MCAREHEPDVYVCEFVYVCECVCVCVAGIYMHSCSMRRRLNPAHPQPARVCPRSANDMTSYGHNIMCYLWVLANFTQRPHRRSPFNDAVTEMVRNIRVAPCPECMPGTDPPIEVTHPYFSGWPERHKAMMSPISSAALRCALGAKRTNRTRFFVLRHRQTMRRTGTARSPCPVIWSMAGRNALQTPVFCARLCMCTKHVI